MRSLRLLLTGIIVGALIASVLPAPHAAAVSDSLVIAQVQTRSNDSATSELIILQNISASDIDVTNWCLRYGSSSFDVALSSPVTALLVGCVEPPNDITRLLLPSAGIISFTKNVEFDGDVVFTRGLADNGSLFLLDSQNTLIDAVAWGSAQSAEGPPATPHPAGLILTRSFSPLALDTDNNTADFASGAVLDPIIMSLYEEAIAVDLCNNIDGVQAIVPDGMLVDQNGDCFTDVCPLIDGLQASVPFGYELNETGECVVIPLEDAILFITELYPNAPSVDDGQEFIELFNPNDRSVDLAGYELQIGPGFTKKFVFSSGKISSGEFKIFSDSETDVVLPNSSGVKLRLINPMGEVVSESEVYSNAQDDESWSLVEDQWIWTNQLTPGDANKPYLEPAVNEVEGVTSVLAPCPAGKFRNPATNRCKNIETAVSQLVPCDPGEERNPDTNRCRQIVTSTSSLTPCKPGQVRNPATNRCRSASTASSTLVPCDEDEERNPETNRCRKIGAVLTNADGSTIVDLAPNQTEGQLNWPIIGGTLLATFGYMAYEWRRELTQRWRLVKARKRN